MSDYHIPVLRDEALTFLSIRSKGKYIDATLGGGGHTREMLERGAFVLGIDADSDAIQNAEQEFEDYLTNHQLTVVRGNFRDIKKIAHLHDFIDPEGILFDLGVSSHQLDAKERGFSFRNEALLDMRMDLSLSVTAADLLNGLGKKELYRLFLEYGEERDAYQIANAIVREREEKPIQSTTELAELIRKTVRRYDGIHPATLAFQALRIAVNDELVSLQMVLPDAFDLLREKGRLVVISFHSLEDRIVKEFLSLKEKEGAGKIITKKIVVPSEEEIKRNNRSRSAKMRVIEKT